MTVLQERVVCPEPEIDTGGGKLSLDTLSEPEVYEREPSDTGPPDPDIDVGLAARQRRPGGMALKLIERAQNGDPAAMERLWLDSQEIAEAVVRAKGPSVLPHEDMVQIALEVVPGTVERYDSTRGASLETFLSRRMLGAVIDAERKHSNISRGDYSKLQDALESDDPNAGLHALTQPRKSDSGVVTPGLTMVSTLVMNGAVSDVPKSLDAPLHVAGSGGTDEVDGGTQIASGSDVHEEVVRAMDDERVRAAIDSLPEQERITILNYDPGPGMNLREIGEQLLGGVTESRASQIHSSAVKRLGRILRGEEKPEPESGPETPDVIRITKVDDGGKLSESEIKANVSAQLAGMDESVVLSEEEVMTVLSYIPTWRWRTVESGGETYQMLVRNFDKFAGDINLDIEERGSDRRAVGFKDDTLTVLIKEFRASDLLLALDIEEQLSGHTEQKVSESYDFSQLTARQLEVVSQLHKTRKEIADGLELSETAVRGLINRAVETIGAESEEDMAIAAAIKGIILLREIPLGVTADLRPRERQLLRDCYALSPADAAKEIGVAKPNVVSGYRSAMYHRIGVKNSVQAALVGLRNGVIDYVPQQRADTVTI